MSFSMPENPAPIVRMIKGQEIVLNPLLDVCYFEAHGKYTRVVLGAEEGLLQMGLAETEARLPPDGFVRIHRCCIVNLSRVRRVNRDEFGRMAVFMVGRNEKLVVSRPHEHLFRAGIY